MAVRPIVTVLGVVALGARLVACGPQVPQPRLTAQPTSALIEVDYPPPPARVEFVHEQPTGDVVWVKGEWLWSGRRWSWRPGMWVVAPERAAYAPRVLVRRGDGKLFFAPGTWRDKDGQEVPAPPERVARSRSGAVINPEGETEPTGSDIHPDAGAASKEPTSQEFQADTGAPR